MAELSFNERLQPSLLDRLADEAPEQRDEARSRRVISLTRLRSLVRRDLGWLLNAGHMEPLVDLSPYPAVRDSVINYGIPDLSGSAVADLDREEIERIIKNAVLIFEPRILAKSLRVRAEVSADRMSQNAIVFEIEGQLWAQPMPAELFLKTEIDLESGQVDVRDAADMAGGR
ncbi:MAG TPA: type VI secretion system baseplate subunit TssE [Wenzhouxiangellaceae bacterium]|nr:type VI secretion system baseplate subunit TssE [Wenzhouxiangellaceae bacterium]